MRQWTWWPEKSKRYGLDVHLFWIRVVQGLAILITASYKMRMGWTQVKTRKYSHGQNYEAKINLVRGRKCCKMTKARVEHVSIVTGIPAQKCKPCGGYGVHFCWQIEVFRFHFVAPSPSFGKSCTTCDVQNPAKSPQIREESEKRCRILPGCFQARQDHTKTVGFTNRALVSVKNLLVPRRVFKHLFRNININIQKTWYYVELCHVSLYFDTFFFNINVSFYLPTRFFVIYNMKEATSFVEQSLYIIIFRLFRWIYMLRKETYI